MGRLASGTREAPAAIRLKDRPTDNRRPLCESATSLGLGAIGWHFFRNQIRSHVGHTVGPDVA
jgi:hypothetical protein